MTESKSKERKELVNIVSITNNYLAQFENYIKETNLINTEWLKGEIQDIERQSFDDKIIIYNIIISKMHKCSDAEEYEQATIYRDAIKYLNNNITLN